MLKECLDYEKDFNTDCRVYDCNVRDYFGNKFYIVYNELLNEVRFMAKNKEYNKTRKELDNRKLKHVIVSKWLEVIDIRKETYKQIETFIPYAKLPYKNNLNIW